MLSYESESESDESRTLRLFPFGVSDTMYSNNLGVSDIVLAELEHLELFFFSSTGFPSESNTLKL